MKKLPFLLVACLTLSQSTHAAPRQAIKTKDGTRLVLTDSVSVTQKALKSTKPKKAIEIHQGDAEDFITQLHDLFPEDKIWERTSFLLDPSKVNLPSLRLVTNSAEDVLKLYNRLAEVRPEWGEWIWEGDFKDAASIALLERKSSLRSSASVFQQRLQAITQSAAKSDANKSKVNPPGRIPTAIDAMGNPLRVTRPASSMTVPKKKKEPLLTRVYAIGQIPNEELEEIMVSVEETISMYSDLNAKRGGDPVERPKLRFHSRTKTLIAIGTESALNIVTEILSAMTKPMDNVGTKGDPFGGFKSGKTKPGKSSNPF